MNHLTLMLIVCFGISLTYFTNQTQKNMETQIKGLRTTIYKVNNLGAATEWYSKAFGKAPYFNEPFYVGFEIEGYELGLLPDDSNPEEKTENVLSYWGVDDMASVWSTMLAHGATASEEPKDVGDGIVVATVKDPWNNVIGLIYNPHFKK